MVRRTQSTTNLGAEAFTLWRDLYPRLHELAALQERLPAFVDDPALLSSALADRSNSFDLEQLKKDTVKEQKTLDFCLERLGIIIALREAPPDPPQQSRATKKRRMEPGGSIETGSPAPTASTSTSATLTGSGSLLDPLSQTAISSISRTSSPIPLPPRSQLGSRASTPLSESTRRDTRAGKVIKLSRRATAPRDRLPNLPIRLPLQPGRLVAFKRHRKPIEGSMNADPDCWIMARVVRSISNDKNRYEVQDVDMDGSTSESGRRRTSWNTTLKSIIPLPIIGQPDTYPLPTLQPGTEVLGLYPDTTTFYLGKIKSGPTEKGRKYKVLFEDDGDTGPLPVAMEHVVALT
ncbi:hypothetical protein CROQUDRAFT_97913 [Cronartium quercuum f. sp. fusiforme G11]|uniref:SGF29 C-terminal domain-containing protein n=1 Tax=Cronartium quercuum f. sp. fusiforme G11 TaxID=708437 RepID=A0A9P6NDD7_9BASI|nr:hypothetical protein CROQUDRAFT_97913 [Cronartium quercuum f. sp. fusiforme G11]